MQTVAGTYIFDLRDQTTQMEMDTGSPTRQLGSIATYEHTFKTNYKGLHAYAYTIIKDDIMAEEMVQNVFYKLWKNRENIQVHESLTAYLYRSVYNECLNYLKHLKVKTAYQSHAARNMEHTHNSSERIKLRDLQAQLHSALKELPEQCRTIFQLSRFEELKYLEIAERLGISVKTVENQMGKALRLLRLKLADFLPIICLLFLNL